MLSFLIDNILRVIFKEFYRSKLSFLVEVFNVALSTMIYYFTSKAFGSAVQESLAIPGMSYFEFIMLGDLFLIFPAYFLEGSLSSFRKAMIDDTFRTLTLLPLSRIKTFVHILLPTFTLSLYRAMTLLIVFSMFSASVNFMMFFKIICLLISS